VDYVQTLHVDRLEKRIGNGCTEPLLAVLESGSEELYAVVKTRNNIQGVLSVVNEWIAYNIAVELGILMPVSGIAIIDKDTNAAGLIDEDDFGSCFYSTYIEKSGILNETIMEFVSNKNVYEKIILFDHLVYNKDRNKGNLLISTGKGDKCLYAIDHTHVFKNETIWDRYCLNQGIRDNDYLDKEILDANGYELFSRSKNINEQSLKEEADSFKKVITKEFLEKIVNDIPADWNVNPKDLEVLQDYLLYRAAHLDEICEMIVNYKEWR